MAEVVVKIPDVDEESVKRFSIIAERAVLQEWRREELLKLSNELLKESKLTEEEALELGRKMKEGRFEKLKELRLINLNLVI